SVQTVADEVIVVDSDSTDGTPALAESLGARVFQRPFTTYADQKNWAASQTTQPYILSLDADEALGEALLADIEAWKSRPPHANAAWSMPRMTYYCGDWIRHGGWYPDRKIRLWSAGAGEWKPATEGGTLHESWVPHDGVEVFEFDSDLLHYSYHTTADHQRQFAKFSLLGAQDAARAGRTSSILKPFARAAFQWFKQAIVQSGWRDGLAGLRVAKWSAVAAFWKWTLVKAAPSHRAWSRVAIIRSDALGDNILTLPLAGALRRLLPHVEVVWICRPYARSVVAKSRAVHSIRVWEEANMDAKAEEALFAGLDAVVFAFPEPRLLAAAARAGVQVRVATGRRWAAFRWANRRMWRSRKHTPEHETAQGLRLLHGLGLPARWRFPEREDWMDLMEWHTSSAGDPVPEGLGGSVLLHPGNHGSANGWSLTRFEDLAKALLAEDVPVVVTGSPQERIALTPWLERMSGTPGFTDAVGAWTLAQLMDAVTQVQCVVASSTGPLHMAAAQGTPTVGLFRSDAPFWPERWGPLGPGEVLTTAEVEAEGGLNLSVEDVLAAVHHARALDISQSL
ncbi:MAG: glycosyltransferase family 9 protein, partial [Flavobacteriales bacterium]